MKIVQIPVICIAISLYVVCGFKVNAQSTEEFVIERPYGKLKVSVISPPAEKLADNPLLLMNFSADRESALPGGRYGTITKPFLDEGHRVVSFDLPAHGERVGKYGSGIAGLSASVGAGEDPFAVFIEDGKAVMDELIKRGLAQSGRIVLCGVSRAGYCVLRLAAADKRVAAVSALAPVTDWRALKEFNAIKDMKGMAAQALENFAGKLVGRPVYVAIGNADTRVGTEACTRFILALNKAEAKHPSIQSKLRYLVVDDSKNHSLNTPWRKEGIQFLLHPITTLGSDDLPR